MYLETENRIALVLLREAAELRRQAEKDGVRVYLEKPNIGVNELTEGDHDTDSASVTCSMSYMVEVWKSERAKICSCKCCGKKCHRNCLKQWAQHRDLFNWSSWACPSCRTCEETETSLQTLTSAATMERLGGGNIVQPSLSTRDALDKYHIVTQKMEDLVANNAGDGEIQYSEVPEIILRCISKDEAALAVAQSSLHVSANLAILVTIRGVSNFCNI
uniref:Zinc finger PHD-type domain-containing protein n=2 Tax=Brassica oleracea var. oleracea TaxID=109376 RepID=A0A0D3A996_BRAOL